MSQTKAQLIDTLVASLLPASDSSVDIGSNAVRFANIYGDTLYGSGANLTGLNIVTDTSPQLGGNLDVNTKNILFGDSASASDDRLIFGAGSDLSIYHDGSHSFISDQGTGRLKLLTSYFNVQNDTDDEIIIQGVSNGQVELYYDNSKKLNTTSTGVTVNGALAVTLGGSFGSGVTFSGANYDVAWVRSADTFRWSDNAVLGFGASDDIKIKHDAINNVNLWINRASKTLKIQHDTENSIVANANGSIELYYDGSKKLETTTTGVLISNQGSNRILDIHNTNGNNAYIAFLDQNTTDNSYVRLGATANEMTIFSGGSEALRLTSSQHVNIPTDNKKLQIGAGQDLQLLHDGTNSNIYNQTNSLYIRSNNTRITNGGVTEHMAKFFENGAVELFYDNSKKFETTSTGIALTGNATFTDGNKSIYGNGGDMEIYHIADNTNVIRGPGKLTIQTDDTSTGISLSSYSGGEAFARFKKNGSVDLYYDNNKKLETKSNGVGITGNLQCNNTLSCGTGLQQANVASFGGGTSNQINIFDGSNTGWGLLLTQSQGNSTASSYHYTTNSSVSKPCAIVNVQNDALHFATNNIPRFRIEHDGHVLPSADNAYDLGSTGFGWRNIFTHDLNLSNEGGANDVDGTWGSYTIQEGEESLFLINRRNGKKYKFALTEVS